MSVAFQKTEFCPTRDRPLQVLIRYRQHAFEVALNYFCLTSLNINPFSLKLGIYFNAIGAVLQETSK
jgi:hypothetical protein